MKTFILIIASCLLLVRSLKVKENPYDAPNKIVEFINKLIEGTQEAQRAHDELYAVQVPKCDEEIAFREGEVSDATRALELSQPQLDKCTNSKIASDAAIESYNYQISVNNQNQISLNETREQERKIFEENQVNNVEILNAIQEAYDIIGTFKGGRDIVENEVQRRVYTFLSQITDHINNMIIDIVSYKHVEAFTPILVTLVQLEPGAVSENDIKKLIGLFQNLETKFSDALDTLRVVETEAIAVYDTTIALYISEMNHLYELLYDETNYNAEMSRCMSREQAVTEEATMKQNKNQEVLDATKAMCTAFVEEYTRQSEGRTKYLESLNKLEGFITDVVDVEKSGYLSEANKGIED